MTSSLLDLDLRIDRAISEVALATPRLALRPMREDDVALLRGTPDSRTHDGSEPGLSDEALTELCQDSEAQWRATSLGYFLVFLTGDPQPIGLIRLRWVPGCSSGRMADLTYTINGRHRARGYGTEAIGAVLAFAFDEARLDYVLACVEPENLASIHVIEQNGMMPIAEGRIGHRLVRRYLMPASAWKARRRVELGASLMAGTGAAVSPRV